MGQKIPVGGSSPSGATSHSEVAEQGHSDSERSGNTETLSAYSCYTPTLYGQLDDWWHEMGMDVELTSDGTLYISTCDSCIDTIIYLYDSWGSLVGGYGYDADNCGHDGYQEYHEIHGLPAGTYTVGVMGWSGGEFHLEVSACPISYESLNYGDCDTDTDWFPDECSEVHDEREGDTSEQRCLAMAGCVYTSYDDHCGAETVLDWDTNWWFSSAGQSSVVVVLTVVTMSFFAVI